MKQYILKSTKIVLLALIVSVGVSYVSAWVGNTSNPPNNNTAEPINVSDNLQTKAGSLTVWNTLTTNKICLGTNCITSWPVGGGAGTSGVDFGSPTEHSCASTVSGGEGKWDWKDCDIGSVSEKYCALSFIETAKEDFKQGLIVENGRYILRTRPNSGSGNGGYTPITKALCYPRVLGSGGGSDVSLGDVVGGVTNNAGQIGSKIYFDTESNVGLDCPAGSVMTGFGTKNKDEGGHNDMWIRCRLLN